MEMPPLISVDWKSPGKDFLPLFIDYYSDTPCVKTELFEQLIDQLGDTPVHQCLEPMATYFAHFGFDLWNLDSGSDMYDLMIVPVEMRGNAHELLVLSDEDDDADLASCMELDRIAPDNDAQVLKLLAGEKKAQKTKSKPKNTFGWLIDTYDLGDYLYVSSHDYFDGVVEHWDEPEAGQPAFPILFDFNQWVPGEIKPLEHTAAMGKGMLSPRQLRLAHVDEHGTFWKQIMRTVGHNDFFRFKRQHGSEWLDWGDKRVEFDNIYATTIVFGDHLYHTSHQKIFKVTATETKMVFASTSPLQSCQLDSGRILLLEKDTLHLLMLDDATETITPLDVQLPQPHYESQDLIYIGNNEVLAFFLDILPHADRPEYSESFLKAGILNLTDHTWKFAALPGIESVHKFDTRILKTQPSDYVILRSFCGNLSVSKGHDDWWVWTQKTNAYGVSMRAWFWNRRSNEVIKIDSKKMPRLEPDIFYSRGLQRYLAFTGTECALMNDFDKIAAHIGTDTLEWKTA